MLFMRLSHDFELQCCYVFFLPSFQLVRFLPHVFACLFSLFFFYTFAFFLISVYKTPYIISRKLRCSLTWSRAGWCEAGDRARHPCTEQGPGLGLRQEVAHRAHVLSPMTRVEANEPMARNAVER